MMRLFSVLLRLISLPNCAPTGRYLPDEPINVQFIPFSQATP
ncbi:hypothetical protein IAD21_06410 (plasmid) [Abditibacteriota bacterium]|nr:hypothetical protein IAD21_06410 [Abditibacteriota bacterium]